MDEAGIEYYFVYMTGLAGKGGGYQNARNSAELFSQLNPYFISVDSLTLFPDTELYQMAQQGLFVPAEEKERIRELQILINNPNIRTHLFQSVKGHFKNMGLLLVGKATKEAEHTKTDKGISAFPKAALRFLLLWTLKRTTDF